MRTAARWFALSALLFFPATVLAAPDTTGKASNANGAETTTAGKKKKKKKKRPETPAAQAKRHRDAGRRAYKARKYEAAVPELEEAYKAEPQVGILLMLGDSYFQLKDFLASYEAYDRALTDHAGDLKPTQKVDADRVIRQLEALTSQLEVMVEEPNATITIDGKNVGTSPMKAPVRVSAAKHRVRVTAPNLEPIEQEADPRPGERLVVPIRFSHEAAPAETIGEGPATLKVTATPSDATIELDGREVGTGTFQGELPSGKHKLVVRAMGFESFVQELELKPGESTSRDAKLESEDKDAPKAAAAAASSSGFTMNVAALGVVSLAGQVKLPVPAGGVGTTALALGGGGVLRAGYSFGLLGIELVGAGLFERHTEKKNIPGSTDLNSAEYREGDIQRRENYSISSIGFFAGAGPRLTTQGDFARLSIGAAGGVTLRQFSVLRETGGSIQDTFKTSAASTAPGVAADLSLTLGSAPGFRVLVGAVALVGFGGDVRTKSGDPRLVPVTFEGQQVEATLPTPAMTIARGAQVFIGPQLGVVLGH